MSSTVLALLITLVPHTSPHPLLTLILPLTSSSHVHTLLHSHPPLTLTPSPHTHTSPHTLLSCSHPPPTCSNPLTLMPSPHTHTSPHTLLSCSHPLTFTPSSHVHTLLSCSHSLTLTPSPHTHRFTSCFIKRILASRGQHFLLLYPTMFSLLGSGCTVRYLWMRSRASSAVNLQRQGDPTQQTTRPSVSRQSVCSQLTGHGKYSGTSL